MKFITLCADDYGLNEAVSQGILHLLTMKRLTAVSCMTTSPDWPKHSAWLHPYRDHVDIGLHFNLTEGQPLSIKSSSIARRESFFSLPSLMAKAYGRFLKVADVEHELILQLEQFIKCMQRLPDFIDGHQHIHHLPVIRAALLKVHEEYLRKHNSYVRISVQRQGGGLKPKILAFTGALILKQQLRKRSIPYNHAFSGIYPFDNANNYRDYFTRFLATAEKQELIMCHPGLSNPQSGDAIAVNRFQELNYLSSAAFKEDCDRYHIQLTRFLTAN
jgi:predicted glycoside hydrolase/deacetylase ChbG (UPF0249 family)